MPPQRMTDEIDLLNELLAQDEQALAAIAQTAVESTPPADHPMWVAMAREKACSDESPADSILNRPAGPEAPPKQCTCDASGLLPLQMQPAVDLDGGVVRCQRCSREISKAIRIKKVRWLRSLAKLHQHQPDHVDQRALHEMGLLFS